ncbi:hypothetical protein EDC94DRAFT_585619 [Helicostylum pulchrum]|nr:hypothetical protein EDC94DRAFT_585619 [Helicostylum pulchrum]
MESYKYKTSSTFKYIKYFKEKPLSNWEEGDFVCFYGSKDVSKTKRKGLQVSFLYCLNCVILRDQDVPDNIKEFVKMKRKDIRVKIENALQPSLKSQAARLVSIKEAIEKFEEDEEELDFSINLLALCKTSETYFSHYKYSFTPVFGELKTYAYSSNYITASILELEREKPNSATPTGILIELEDFVLNDWKQESKKKKLTHFSDRKYLCKSLFDEVYGFIKKSRTISKLSTSNASGSAAYSEAKNKKKKNQQQGRPFSTEELPIVSIWYLND